MTSEVQQTYYGWQHGELSEQGDSQHGPVPFAEVIEHGSISFGRFAFESLSWERRSMFTHNERQEELEKFKSPGSVAKKKAYFEEYYKNIRALKAMQNQQTELSLEYGADGSISSQTGDDDEPALSSTNHDKMPESINPSPFENHSVEVSFEKEHSEASKLMGLGSLEDATATETVELHNSEVMQGGACNNSVQMQISYSESLVHSLAVGSSEEINLSEGNHVKLIQKNDTKLKMQPDITAHVCLTDPTISEVAETYFLPVDTSVLEKEILTSHKPKEDPVPSPMPTPKEHAFSVRCPSNISSGSLSERTKLSLDSKHLPQKVIDKAEIDIALSKKISCKSRGRDKFSFVASQRSLAEQQIKVSTPRPVPISRERKGAISTESSEIVRRSSKVSTRWAPGQFYSKGNFRVQEDSWVMSVRNTVRNSSLQTKSTGHGKFENNLENKCKTFERSPTTEHLKSRSINLPSRNNPDPNGVICCQSESSSCGGKSKMANSAAGRKYEGNCSKQVTPFQQSRNIKLDSFKVGTNIKSDSIKVGTNIKSDSVKQKQVAASQKHEPYFGARKSAIVAKNSRLENPRWR